MYIPITSSKGNSSYLSGISHTKLLANSSRNKASVISSISKYQQYATLHQFHHGGWHQQNHGSAHQNPGPTGSGVVIKKQGRNSTAIKIAKAVKCMGPSYEGELKAK